MEFNSRVGLWLDIHILELSLVAKVDSNRPLPISNFFCVDESLLQNIRIKSN